MTDRADDPLDAIVAGLRRMPVPAQPTDEALLARLAGLAPPSRRAESHPRHPFRRLLMNPTFRYASAATLLLAVLGWLALTPSPSLALADVIKAAEEHKLVRFQMEQTTDDRQERNTASALSTVTIDLVTPRLRIETGHLTMNNVLDFHHVAVYDYPNDRILAATSHVQVVTKERAVDPMQAGMIKLVEDKGLAKRVASLYRIPQMTIDDVKPMSDLGKDRAFLDSLRKLQTNPATLATQVWVDGKELAKYRLNEGNKTSSLWVDPATKLPTRIEFEILDPTPRIARNEWVYTDFDWDPEVADPAALFSTEPPAGYTVEDHRNDR